MALDSPVRLTVSEIRQRIFEISETRSDGAGSLAGQLFHHEAAAAVEDGHPACWKSVLDSELNAEEWASVLYEQALGAELTRLQPALCDNGEAVLTLWRGVHSYTRWFCGLLAEAMRSGELRYDPQIECWHGAGSLFQTEREAEMLLSQPNWSRKVFVSGRMDHLVRLSQDRWCVVEFKLGGGHAEADAAQACLYHELLGGGSSSAAIIHFAGEPKSSDAQETVLQGAWIEQVRPALLALIGALAGVAADSSSTPVGSVDAPDRDWPRPPGEAELQQGKKLLRALQEFHAEARMVAAPLVGPAFVRYLLEPGRGVTARKIEQQGPNLQMRLHLDAEPILQRIEGVIAVDVQRLEREFVSFESISALLAGKEAGDRRSSASLVAGVDLKGQIHFVDLARESPHLLVGGMSGSGKSEWLRSAIACLLLVNDPTTLRLVLIDPKKNAFPEMSGSPFLWRTDALVDTPDDASIHLLEELLEEIARRNELFKQVAADDLEHYRQKRPEALPHIVCVVDEFADLLMGGGKAQRDAFERAFVRIAQMGRAAGIHLILATQRPSRQVISGILKANLTGKIALRVANRTDSSVLLDQGGAQNLLGKGDLLLSTGYGSPIRLQAPRLGDEARQRIFRALV